jgi:two-component system KDP operon response regulator KdpE
MQRRPDSAAGPRSGNGAPASSFRGALKPHPKVLIVDSDPAIGRMLNIVLESEGYRVLWSRNSADGLTEAVNHRPDAIILELDLPDGGGFDVLGSLREWCEAPVSILSVRAATADKVRALDGGANDYMVKPIAPEELAASLRVLLRCEPPTCDGPLLVSGALRIDMATREVTVNGCMLELTATEEAVLYVLARHAGMVVPRERLLRIIWGSVDDGKIHDLQVHIARLRRKLGELTESELICGEGGVGYRLSIAAEPGRTFL